MTTQWIKLLIETWQIKMYVFYTNLILTTVTYRSYSQSLSTHVETFRVSYVTSGSSGTILSTMWIVCDLKSIFLTLFSLFFLMNFPTKLHDRRTSKYKFFKIREIYNLFHSFVNSDKPFTTSPATYYYDLFFFVISWNL